MTVAPPQAFCAHHVIQDDGIWVWVPEHYTERRLDVRRLDAGRGADRSFTLLDPTARTRGGVSGTEGSKSNRLCLWFRGMLP